LVIELGSVVTAALPFSDFLGREVGGIDRKLLMEGSLGLWASRPEGKWGSAKAI